MKFIQYYLDCLSQASYLIGDETTGRAVVVDPRRDVSEYLRDASDAGMKIELVIETHFHADFVTGHLELAATGAEIAYSSAAATDFAKRDLAHGERIDLGDVQLEIRHTPGHTPESLSVVIWEHANDGVPYGVLTGDTLFVGDVGRPDLLSSVGHSESELAAQLYTSLHEQLLTLPDATRVFPGHGAGSSCGKNLSTATSSTIGEQREMNYALRAANREEFIQLVTAGQTPAPRYFAFDADLNRRRRNLLDEAAGLVPLTVDEVDHHVAAGAAILDGRDANAFADGHLSGSINVGLGGRFAEFAGSVFGPNDKIILVVDDGHQVSARNRLARIGFDRVVGYLQTPSMVFAAEPDRVERASRLGPEVAQNLDHAIYQIVDVRNPGEVGTGKIDGAIEIPVRQLSARLGELDSTKPTVVYCAGGYRSSLAASILRKAGFASVSDVLGGYAAWNQLTLAVA